MAKKQVFLDTDVIISSLLSTQGAAYSLIHQTKVDRIISLWVREEVVEVAKRLNLDNPSVVLDQCRVVGLELAKEVMVETYGEYVTDDQDAHVVAGAVVSKVKFLLTYNHKHYRVESIRQDLGLLILRPGEFLQFLRSQGEFN